jgi:hypothetical protein
MASADVEKLDALLAEVSTDNAAVAELLDSLAHQNGLTDSAEPDEPGGTDVIPEKYQILIAFTTEQEQGVSL